MDIISQDRLSDKFFYIGNIIINVFGDYAEWMQYSLILCNIVM